MNSSNYNVLQNDPSDKNNRMLNFKLKNINNKINEQKCHIDQLKEAIANKETDNMLLEKRLNSLQKLHVDRIKEIEDQTKEMEQIQKSVWNERNILEAKIKELENQIEDVQPNSSENVSESRLNGTKNGLKNYLTKTDEEIVKLKNRIDDIKKDKESLLKTVKPIL